MTFFPFVDPNRRPQAKIRKMTEELTQKFQAIDPDLTLIHNDNFIDYGPEVFPQLSSIYWDPRVANHSMEHFVYSEYQLKYRNYPFYWFTPYGEWIYESYRRPGGNSNSARKILKMIDHTILKVIHDYQAHNLFYWKDLFSEKQLDQERLEPYNRPTQFIGPGEIISLPMDLTDPKHRSLEAVNKNTIFLEKQLSKLDYRLTIIHDETFIDFGPDDGRFIAEWGYDPEEYEADDPILSLSYTEYTIYYNSTPIFNFTPYSQGSNYCGDYFKGGIPNAEYLELPKELVETINNIISEYMVFNLYYWRNQYTPEDFQYEIHKYKEMWHLD